jgi:hypothetical protein
VSEWHHSLVGGRAQYHFITGKVVGPCSLPLPRVRYNKVVLTRAHLIHPDRQEWDLVTQCQLGPPPSRLLNLTESNQQKSSTCQYPDVTSSVFQQAGTTPLLLLCDSLSSFRRPPKVRAYAIYSSTTGCDITIKCTLYNKTVMKLNPRCVIVCR